MSSRYWGALFAAIGLAFTAFGLGAYVVGLNEAHKERHQPYRYAADKPRDIDPALENKADAQPLEYREPCKEPKGRDESDLCAQWRAAEAGEQSALWAKWSLWITGAGVIGLIVTIIQSRAALERAREANKIASGAQRPWVSINVSVSKMVVKDQIVSFDCAFTFENVGETVATHFVWTSNIRFVTPDDLDLDNLGYLDGETFDRVAEHVLIPGDPFVIDGTPSSEDTPREKWKVINGSDGKPWAMAPIIVVAAYYRSEMFPEKEHVSIRCFAVGHAKGIIGLHHGVVYLQDMEIDGSALAASPYGVQIAT